MYKPYEPRKLINKSIEIVSSPGSLADILKMVPAGIEYKDVHFEIYEEYESKSVYVYYYADVVNENYEKELYDYNKQMIEYNDLLAFQEFKKNKDK